MKRVMWIFLGSLAVVLTAACSGSVDGGSGNQGGGGGSDGALCAAYDDAPAQAVVTIRFINNRPAPIHVDIACGYRYAFEVNGVTHQGHLGPLQLTCEQAKTQGKPVGDCWPTGPEIAPGDSWEAQWDGLFYDQTQMPAECYALGMPAADCWHVTPAPMGPLRITARAYATQICDMASFECYYTDPVSGTTDFMFTGDTTVEVAINP